MTTGRRERRLMARMMGLIVLCSTAIGSMALAQPTPSRQGETVSTRIEGSVALTINSRGIDANSVPHCAALGLPCSHNRISDWGGFGIDAGIAARLTPHVALVGEAGASSYDYDTEESLIANRPVFNHVRTYLSGVRFRTPFITYGGNSHEPTRFFAHVMTGFERSTIQGTRSMAQIGAGMDFIADLPATRLRPGGGAMTVRMEIDYRPTLGDRGSRGWRSVFGVVLGPHRR